MSRILQSLASQHTVKNCISAGDCLKALSSRPAGSLHPDNLWNTRRFGCRSAGSSSGFRFSVEYSLLTRAAQYRGATVRKRSTQPARAAPSIESIARQRITGNQTLGGTCRDRRQSHQPRPVYGQVSGNGQASSLILTRVHCPPITGNPSLLRLPEYIRKPCFA